MRLDLYLKKTSLIKRRTVAKEIVERGHTLINNKVAKPSSDVKTGDVIELRLGPKTILVKAIVELKGTKEFPDYEILETNKAND